MRVFLSTLFAFNVDIGACVRDLRNITSGFLFIFFLRNNIISRNNISETFQENNFL